jgi:hypothetical protein
MQAMRGFRCAAVIAAAVVVSGCANSVINDPVEMERRRAFVERQQQAHERFWGRAIRAEQPRTRNSDRGSRALYQPSARSPSQCRAIGGTWNHASNFCWRV